MDIIYCVLCMLIIVYPYIFWDNADKSAVNLESIPAIGTSLL